MVVCLRKRSASKNLKANGPLVGGAGVAVDEAALLTPFACADSREQLRSPCCLLAWKLALDPATELKATTGVLNGEVNPHNINVTDCAFHYGSGQRAPCLNPAGEEIGTKSKPISAPVKAHADVEGLEGGTGYSFYVHVADARKEEGKEEGTELNSDEQPFKTATTAVISGAVASEVTAASALVSAQVNPEGVEDTKCVIEYGVSVAYGSSVPCESGELTGSLPVGVSARLVGLSGETTYHWRVVVSDANDSEIQGADNTFIALPADAG